MCIEPEAETKFTPEYRTQAITTAGIVKTPVADDYQKRFQVHRTMFDQAEDGVVLTDSSSYHRYLLPSRRSILLSFSTKLI